MRMWEPILDKSDVVSAKEAIAAIIRDLPADPDTTSPIQLCESALLFAYLGKSDPSSDWTEKAAAQLNLAIERVSADWNPEHLELYGGMAEVGWIVEHFGRLLREDEVEEVGPGGSDLEDEDPLSDVDGLIIRHLERHAGQQGVYDLISGLVGLGVYFLQRFPRKSAVSGLELVLEQLELSAVRVAPGRTWFTAPNFLPQWQRERCPEGYYNLGVAHGVPGVIYLLAEALSLGVEPKRSKELLTDTVSWLMAQQLPPHMLSRFSSWVAPGNPPENSRLGWCYGDLGLAAVLHHVGCRIGREDWRNYAKRVLDRCLDFPLQDAGCNDAALCHGAMGISHILNRIYQSSGDTRYREKAITWLRRGLEMRKPGSGVGGFLAYRPEHTPEWDPDPTFLSGGIGIALVLLSAIQAIEPRWDQLLLLSGSSPFMLILG